MTLEETVAEILGIQNHRHVNFEDNHQIAGLLDDLKEFIIDTSDEKFLVLVIEESELQPDVDFVDEKYLAHLAGFYNARYLFEMVKFEGLKLPVGEFQKYIKPVHYNSKNYAATIVQLPRRFSLTSSLSNNHENHHKILKRKNVELNLNQVFSVAEKLSTLHESCLPEKRKKEAKEIVEENYQLISDVTSRRLQSKINDYLEITLEKNGKFFKNTDVTFEKFSALFKTFKDFQQIYPESNLPIVLCHGNLGHENLFFNEKNEIEFIDHWDSLHFGSAAEDLSYLIISSLAPNVRRNNYMKIFRRYYYTLVDTRTIKFKLHDIKEFYLKFLKYAVFYNFPTLAAILGSSDYSDEDKFKVVNRWDAALDDAYDVEMDNYVSDNEDLLTVQNSENRSVAEAVLKGKRH